MSQAQAARLEAIASSLEEEARQLRALAKELRGASAADEEDEDAASRKCSRAAAAASAPTTTRERDTRQSTAPEPPKAAHKHVLVKIGKSARTPGRGGGCPAALRDVQEQGVDHLLRRGVRERGYLREWQARVPH